jgi:hypothetical protein
VTGGAEVKGQAGKAVHSREQVRPAEESSRQEVPARQGRKYQPGKAGKEGVGKHVKVRQT